jgi:hypothetical protein
LDEADIGAPGEFISGKSEAAGRKNDSADLASQFLFSDLPASTAG